MTVETATMPLTFPIKIAKYLLALRVSDDLKDTDSYNAAVALVKETYADVDVAELRRIAVQTSGFYKVLPYSVVRGYSADLKSSVKYHIRNNPKYTKEEGDLLHQAILVFEKPELYSIIYDRILSIANKISPKFGSSLAAVASKQQESKGSAGEYDVEAMYETLRDIVKTITGKAGLKVTQEQLNKFKLGSAKQATVAASYTAIRLRINKRYDADLNRYIGNKDAPPYVHEVYAHMSKLGYETHRVITATSKLPLKVSIAAGKLIYLTDDGRVIDGGIPADAIKITFMKTYDRATGTGAYLNYTTPSANGVTRKYTSEHNTKAGEKKFDTADLISENITKYVTKWNRDLTSRDDTTAMAATACMMIYKTGMRVGSKLESRSVSGKVSYGALSLLASQVTLSGSKITLKYTAKKQVAQTHIIEIKDKYDKLLYKNIKEFKTGKGPKDLLFSYESHTGTIKRLNPTQLTAYLKSMGYSAGIHKTARS